MGQNKATRGRAPGGRVSPAGSQGPKRRQKGIGVRFPRELHERVTALATATGKSANTVINDGFHYYFASYTTGPDFKRRAKRATERRERAVARLTGETAEPGPGSGQTVAAQSSDVVSTVVRVDKDMEGKLNDLKDVLGESLNDLVIEATTMWLAEYPRSPLFRDEAFQRLHSVIDDLKRLDAPADVFDELSAEFNLARSQFH